MSNHCDMRPPPLGVLKENMKCIVEVLTCITRNSGVSTFSEAIACHRRHTDFKPGSRSQARNVYLSLGYIRRLSVASVTPAHSEERPLRFWFGPLYKNGGRCCIDNLKAPNSLWIFGNKMKWKKGDESNILFALFLYTVLQTSFQIICFSMVGTWWLVVQTSCPFHNAAWMLQHQWLMVCLQLTGHCLKVVRPTKKIS